MQGSRVPVRKWLLAMYILSISRKSISSIQLGKTLGVTQKSAWFMAHRIREACVQQDNKLAGIVEADETYIGGKEKNRHATKKLKLGRGAKGKTAVFGIKEREGKVTASVVENTEKETLQGIIRNRVKKDSAVFTDDHRSYTNLDDYKHAVVRHSAREYVDGIANINGIESFWALLKRGVYGTYHNVSKKHLQRYVDEFVFRHNTTPADFLKKLCQNGIIPIPYKTLIA